MTTRIRAAALAAGATVLLSACAGHDTTAASAPPTTTVTATATRTVTEAPMDSGLPTAALPTAPLSDGPEAQRTPTDLVQAVMTAYQVTEPVTADAWYARLAPYLSDRARQEYIYTDPAQVKVHQLVGLAVLIRQTAYLAVATQGTDAGTYTVSMSRDDSGVLRVDRIDEPGTAGS